MSFDMLNRAIEITSEIHQPSFKYLKAILENWRKEGFTSLEQVEEHEKNDKKRQEEQIQEATELYSKNTTIRCHFRKGE